MMAGAGDIRAGRAFVELYANNSNLLKGLADAQRKLKDFGASVSAIGTKMMAAGAAITAPFLAAAKSFMTIGSQLNDMAARTGLSTNALSELGFAAEQSGSSLEAVEVSIRKMQKSIGEASTGSKSYVDALKAVGTSYAQLNGLSPEKQFEVIADGLNRIKDPTLKTAAAMEIFGRSGTALLPMLGDMKALREEARRLGVSMGPEQAAAADAMGDAWDRMKSAIKGATFAIGSAIAENVTKHIDSIKDMVVASQTWIKANGDIILSVAKLGVQLTAAGAAVFAFGKSMTAVAAIVGGLRALVALNPALFVMISAITGVAVVLANAKLQGISFGESVLDIAAKITGLDNAYTRLKRTVDNSKQIAAPIKEIEKGIANKDPKQMAAGLSQLRANRDRIKNEYEAMKAEVAADQAAFKQSAGMNYAAGYRLDRSKPALAQKETDLKDAETKLQRYKEMYQQYTAVFALTAMIAKPVEMALSGAKIVSSYLDAGVKAGYAYTDGVMSSLKTGLGQINNAIANYNVVKAEGIRDPEDREKALANLKHDEQAKGMQGNAMALAANEKTRQQELANIKARYAEEDKKRAEDIAKREREIMYETEQARIEAKMTGHAKELALLELRQKKEREDVAASGVNPNLLAAKQALERQSINMPDARSAIAGTFSASAVSGMSTGNIQQRQLDEQIKTRMEAAATKKLMAEMNKLMAKLNLQAAV